MDYALEGSVFVAGAVVQWLRDGLQIIRSAADVGALAASVPGNGGVYLVPAFTGLGAPYWDPDARGAILVAAELLPSRPAVASAVTRSACGHNHFVLRIIETDRNDGRGFGIARASERNPLPVRSPVTGLKESSAVTSGTHLIAHHGDRSKDDRLFGKSARPPVGGKVFELSLRGDAPTRMCHSRSAGYSAIHRQAQRISSAELSQRFVLARRRRESARLGGRSKATERAVRGVHRPAL
jgi:hypothetical protein